MVNTDYCQKFFFLPFLSLLEKKKQLSQAAVFSSTFEQ